MRTANPKAEFESHPHWFTESSLKESIRSGECLVCSNLVHSERRAIHSFLWEGMMSPRVRSEFLKGGGFCVRHFWMAKRIEDEGWRAGGIGVAILCENLVGQTASQLPSEADLGRRKAMGRFRYKRDFGVPPSGSGCIFCHDWIKREESLIETLEYLKNRREWSKALEQSPLCVHHVLVAFHLWREPADKLQLRAAFVARLRELQADLKEFIRKHDWNHREEPMGREKSSVQRAIQVLTGLLTQFPFQGTFAEEGGNNGTRDR